MKLLHHSYSTNGVRPSSHALSDDRCELSHRVFKFLQQDSR